MGFHVTLGECKYSGTLGHAEERSMDDPDDRTMSGPRVYGLGFRV